LFGNGKRTVFKVLKDSPENFRDLSILADCDTDKSIDAARKLVCRLYDQKGKLRLDDVWLQTTLNTPNISGVWQIKKWSLVSLKAHQPLQGQSTLAGLVFF
jgi:hypothetical protein